ncbi:hypothetical protein BKA82DRAFT_995243 [Pisolithus tinctorius]|uniref:Uncharacterized protein n=1 Tax=Pisolithus tinctorius Marx 270 TaxID=870435 RepID=A0A0C3KME9_PISTI|nr:hypothetical protein BKA82DRAFT_995243 [Pisolithus tinctorius]KIO10782.1 hypothetical protein M404DRAFT_995243 [Pisolithus tinctorius Marx 270]
MELAGPSVISASAASGLFSVLGAVSFAMCPQGRSALGPLYRDGGKALVKSV